MPVKYKASQVYKSALQRARNTDKHYYMHQLDNTQLWSEYEGCRTPKLKQKMRNELYKRGFRREDFVAREDAE